MFVLLPGLMLQAQKSCGTEAYQAQIRKDFPSSIYRNGVTMDASAPTQTSLSGADPDQVIVIPVVVHLLYHTSPYEITDEKIISQISILNRDFNLTELASLNIPQAFSRVAGAANIRFQLARVDPDGRATTGINRKKSARELWGNDDKIKDPAFGGVKPWDSRYYLNIWLGNLVPGLLGYASAPGSPAHKDGVVIRTNVFGEASGSFSKGRTTVHEVGHWLNLKHLWGEQTCGSDEVEDTPPQKTFNQGCPGFPKLNTSCGNGDGNGEMYMNFMDFTDDACMMMFTKGQVARMRSVFYAGGARESILQSRALGTPWNNDGSMVISQPDLPVTELAIKATPQPVVGSVVLSAGAGSLDQRNYTIMNVEGKAMMQGVLAGKTPALDLSRLRPGMYFIRLSGISKAVRILKQ